MKYREQLLYYIIELGDEEALSAWIEEQPLLEQPDIFRELQELAAEIGGENEELEMLSEEFSGLVDQYEDIILDEKLAEANYIMAMEAQEKAAQEVEETKKGIRSYIIECIVTNQRNAQEMKQLAQQVMDLEKSTGEFNEDNWAPIL
ncbi:hypothetical protein [Flavobacterium capsici]|uniref:Uncharacterized protein n=1 Tax=Flavobacterium capsici TaxID=3075618 RepID=A0AA96ETL0_9FLAO|nr:MULTISPECIES: hypothetical protein [unclassified Flavobacterium]WNM17979.1 hypothetical protein RN608_08130 [Flavobacterium sp. PMR2A8]WNM22031.1 hypothetical protein RN605_01430 [Flavobacterium sp. PMTSA4]